MNQSITQECYNDIWKYYGCSNTPILLNTENIKSVSDIIQNIRTISTSTNDLDREKCYGSNNTKNLEMSYGDKINKNEYYFAFNKYLTDGISAMSDNSEKDSFRNSNTYLNYGYNFTENFKIQNGLRVINSSINYDEVTAGRSDKNKSNNNEYIYNLTLSNKIENFNHKLIRNLNKEVVVNNSIHTQVLLFQI